MANRTVHMSDDQLEKMDNTLVVRIQDATDNPRHKRAVVGWGTLAGTQRYDDREGQSLAEILRALADEVERETRPQTLESVYIVYQK